MIFSVLLTRSSKMRIYKSLIKTSRHAWMRNVGTKRRIWTTVRCVPKEGNEEDIGPIKKSIWE